MARRDEQERKLELLAQLSQQRAEITSQRGIVAAGLAGKKAEIKDKINVPKRIKSSVASSFSVSPVKWFLGSAVGGLVLSKILFGRKKVYRYSKSDSVTEGSSRGLLASAVIFVGKPFLKRYLVNKGKTMLMNKFAPGKLR